MAGDVAGQSLQVSRIVVVTHVAVKFRLHCFAERIDAEAFIAEFGGVHFDPKTDRGKGKRRNAWVRNEEWQRVLESGPLKVPEILAN